jgi:hypothetical protein
MKEEGTYVSLHGRKGSKPAVFMKTNTWRNLAITNKDEIMNKTNVNDMWK